MEAEHESARTVVLALGANLGIALAKAVAALVTRSSALLAEATHAFADSGNEVLLLVAQRRGGRAADARHPLGYGREAYFWALIASVGVFVAGAFFSIREGVEELLHPTEAARFVVAYVVLGVALVLEGLSLLRAYRQLHSEAIALDRDFVEQLMLTSDPTTRAVFGEDAAAVAGNVVALIGVALHQATGSALPDGVAAVVIGVILAVVGFELARRNRDFLIGEQAPAGVRERIRARIEATRGVVTVQELLATFVGPRRLWVLARIDVDDDLAGGEVERLARRLEAAVVDESPYIIRADVVAVGTQTADVPS